MSDIKIILVGHPKVGKSCILSRFVSNTFDEHGSPTLGVSFLSKTLKVMEKDVKLNIWDTAGQERFSSLTKLYSRDAQVVVFVYDITSKESFQKMNGWHLNLVEQGFDDNAVFAVVGNKEDLVEFEEVSLQEAKEFSARINALFFKTSAKNNLGIDELFRKVCEKIVEKNTWKTNSVILTGNRIKKKTCCG
jgi:small GTP-binding protein